MWLVRQIVCDQETVDVASGLGGFRDIEGDPGGSFFQLKRTTVPGERPTPVHADFIMRIDYVFRAKFVLENGVPVLRNAYEGISQSTDSLGPGYVQSMQRGVVRCRRVGTGLRNSEGARESGRF